MAAIHDSFELPPDKAALHRRAVRLEWWTIAFFVVAISALAIVLGQSQAMKAAWVEDILALAPPIAFLIANRYRNRPVDDEHPYGHHRSVAIAFLASALALLTLGGYILVESVWRLVGGERPPIGLIEVFGHPLWLGWPMIAVLLATMVPAILLGRAKTKLAAQLHDKVLYADAEMNRADWLTAGAAVLGIIGIGAGLWWADAVAAIIISADIVRDGLRTTRTAVADLMDRMAPVGPVYQAGTLSGNPLAMAAGAATLRELARPGVYARLEATSRALAEGLRGLAEETGVELTTGSIGGMFGLFFHPGPVRSYADARKAHAGRFRRFFHAMLDDGIYLAPSPYEAGFVSLAHRAADVDRTLDAARRALRRATRVC